MSNEGVGFKGVAAIVKSSIENARITAGIDIDMDDEKRVADLVRNSSHHARLFTELQEYEEKGGNWKETARWVKFEEDVDAGALRWSKPHVGTISMHAIHEITNQIEHDKGTIALDIEAEDLKGVIEHFINYIRTNRDESESALVHARQQLLARHDHKSITTKKKSQHFLKKVEHGAEGCSILVSENDHFKEVASSIIRMKTPIKPQDSEIEIDLPIRFYCIVVGPETYKNQLHEMGRAYGVLMSDDVFHEVAYNAASPDDVVAGIHEFLDKTWLLPPDEWDPSIRIDPPTLKANDRRSHLEDRRIGQSEGIDFGNGGFKASEHEVGKELQRTGRFAGGLIDDIKRKAPFIINGSDFLDALNLQCLATFIFLYFAVLTPIVTFGGLLGDATDNKMAAIESIFGGAIAGALYHLFCGQPLTIIGSTGPILVFETIMANYCKDNDLEYLEFRWWVGFWTGILCIVIAVTDGSFCVQYITRYTEESFATLISLIFIVDGFKKIVSVGEKYPVNSAWEREKVLDYGCTCEQPTFEAPSWGYTSSEHTEDWFQDQAENSVIIESQWYPYNRTWTGAEKYICSYKNRATTLAGTSGVFFDNSNLTLEKCFENCGVLAGTGCSYENGNLGDIPYVPDVYYFSWFLCLGTLGLAFIFKTFFASPCGPSLLRKLVSDFAVIMAIAIMVGIDIGVGLETPKLFVPSTFQPTRSDRGWWINPIDKNPSWTIGLALPFSLLSTILIFMDQQITTVIVNRKENKLQKACGYHLDLLVVAIALMICSFCGLPWFVAATVLSITHVNSLKRYDAAAAPGETPQFSGVYEQRLTGFCIFLLIGLSVLFTSVLARIPLPVLYGVFIYMGLSSLRGNQFFDRILLFFMPEKFQPDYIYLRHVKLRKVHIFTVIQLLCFGILYVIKSIKKISIAFPIMVVAIVGIRKLFDFFPKLFSQRELSWLDDIMPHEERRKMDDERIRRSRTTSQTSGRGIPRNQSVTQKMSNFVTHMFKKK